jgi:hypothetical protein
MPALLADVVVHLINDFLPLRLLWDRRLVSIVAFLLTRAGEVGYLAPTTVTHN